MAEFLFGSAFGLAALLAAMGVVLCVAAALHWGRHREHGLIPYIFYPAIFVIIIYVIFSDRNLNLPIERAVALSGKHPFVTWSTRVASLFLLFAASERIGRRFLHYGRKPDAPMLLILAFWLFVLTNVATSALFGTHPWISHEYVYTVLAGFAALLVTPQEGDTAIRSARNALFIFLVLSALCIAWRPEMVLTRDYQGVIPGLNVRYSGLSEHSNTLGPVVIVFLVCLWSSPYTARWLNLFGWTIGCASLILAQVKTSWIAFVLCASCLFYFHHGDFVRQRLFDFRRPFLPATLLSLTMLATCALAVTMMYFDGAERVGAFFETRVGAEMLTLTGRSQIWEVAVQEWRNNPLFGYGLTIWNKDYRAQIRIPSALSAHNQFYQSLASAGIFGVAGLAIYVLTLFWFVLKTTKASRGLSLALLILLCIHSISSVTLSRLSGYGLVELTHLLLLMVLASQFASTRLERRGAKALEAHLHAPRTLKCPRITHTTS